MNSYIKYISEYFPQKKYSNDDFFNEFPSLLLGKESLLKTGVRNRYIVNENETASDLAYNAATKLFDVNSIDPKEIDFLIFCSTEFDHYTPTTSAILQDRLNLSTNIGAIDMVSSCTGFIHSLSVANGLLKSNSLNNVLLLCVSTLTKTFHSKDANSKFLFGDAATAILIERADDKAFGKFVFGTDGGRSDYIIVKDGAGRNKITKESYIERVNEFGNVFTDANFYMNGTGVFLFGVKTVPTLIDKILDANQLNITDIDFFVLHQANEFLLKTVQKKMNIPKEKFVICMEDTGNTVAATIPIAYNSLLKQNLLHPNQKILVAAFGTGLTWGGTIIYT